MGQFLAFWGGMIFTIWALGVDLKDDGAASTPWGYVVISEERE